MQIIQKFTTNKLASTVFIVILLTAPLFLSDFRLGLLAKFLAFAILAMGLNLLWGYTGVLSLGHGVFFGLGAYAMAMHLKLVASNQSLPDFMSWSGIVEIPWFWVPFQSPILAIFLALVIPMTLAVFLGFLTFRNRIGGVYFTILTQALVIVFVTLFVGQQAYTGGTNGITGFSTIFDVSLSAKPAQLSLYFITILLFVLCFLFCRFLVNSRFGKVLVAIRDGENRLRFSGYNPTVYKTFVYSISAGMAGLAGMLFVLQERFISPTAMGIIPSIEMALWVALGGRGTMVGPIVGSLFTNYSKTFFSESYPDLWLFFLGALFIIVVVFLPNGMVGLYQNTIGRWMRKNEQGKQERTKESRKQATSV